MVLDTEVQRGYVIFSGLPRWHGGKEAICPRKSRRRRRSGRLSWRRMWQPILVFLSVKIHRQRSLVGCNPWGRKESDKTERLNTITHNFLKLKCNPQQRWTLNLSLTDSKHVPSTSLLCSWLMRQKETTFALCFFFSHINSKGSSCFGYL